MGFFGEVFAASHSYLRHNSNSTRRLARTHRQHVHCLLILYKVSADFVVLLTHNFVLVLPLTSRITLPVWHGVTWHGYSSGGSSLGLPSPLVCSLNQSSSEEAGWPKRLSNISTL